MRPMLQALHRLLHLHRRSILFMTMMLLLLRTLVTNLMVWDLFVQIHTGICLLHLLTEQVRLS